MTDAVVIASHARVDEANAKTLRLLAERGVPRELVHVVVAPDEAAAYRAGLDRGLYGEVTPGAPGLLAQRNAIIDIWPEGARLVSCDDDLTDLVRRADEKHTEPIVDAMALFARGWAECERADATLWGIYPVLNPFFMKPTVTTDLKFCIGHLCGFVNRKDTWARLTLDVKEDYERTLARYEHDGAVIRLNDVAARTKMGTSGGIGALDKRRRANRRAVADLQERWPGYVRLQKRRSAQGVEIRLG